MAVVRASGVTVATLGSVQLGRETGTGRRKRGAAAAAARPADGGAVVAELKRLDMELVDAVPLVKQTQPVKRGTAPRAAIALDVPLAADEEALVLLEEEGEYRWIYQGQRVEPATASRTKRGGPRGKAAGARKRFAIELQVGPVPAARGGKRRVKRNWFTEMVTDKAVAYVFRFAIRVAGKPLVKFMERKVATGLVAIGSADLAGWQSLADDAPLPRALPKDRAARVLLFVHGTFSSTIGSFGALTAFQEGRDLLTSALAHYDAVIGFDHRTLTVDPAENAGEILQRLRSIPWPRPPEIDFVAYSRGGLVARSLVEQLLPKSGWKIGLGRMVFVGCTNCGTQLAEPENWARFVDHYTNFALGAVRALSFVPGAQGYTTIAGHAIRGVAAFVKALATGAVTDKLVPGLAAMEPDGAFVAAINATNDGQVAAAGAQFYAITSNFQASRAQQDGSTPELPTKLLLRIANWGADQLYREDNDLVVHVASMTHIDPAGGQFVKGTLDYGSNATVYHTNYFAQPRTAKQLGTWFGLAAVTSKVAPVKRGARRGRAGASGTIAAKADPDATAALALVEDFARAQIVGPDGGNRAGELDLALGTAKTLAPPGPDQATARAAEPALQRRSARAVNRAPIIVRLPSGGSHTLGGGSRALSRSQRKALKRAAQRSSAKAPAPMDREPPAPAVKPEAPKAAPRKVECHFLAEMDSQLQIDIPGSVDVTISREEIEAAATKITARGKAKVVANAKLIVEVIEHKELRVSGKRREDVAVPAPGKPATVSFKVIGDRVGQGELSVQIRQGSIPLATLWLRPTIVAKRAASVPRLQEDFDLAAYPLAEPPLDELRIIETVNGGSVSYTFMLDLHSLKVREQFRSEPLDGARDAYVVKLMNEIGDSWIPERKNAVQAFENDIRAIGGRMFSQLLPPRMQDLLWKYRDRIRSVQVFSQEPFIPWELIYLKDPQQGVVAPGSKFLGELGLLRWLYDGFPPGRLRIRRKRVRYLMGEYDYPLQLPQAAEEGAMLERIFAGKPIKAELAALDAVLKGANGNGPFDLLHICCHGEAAGEQASQARVFVNGRAVGEEIDGDALKATTVEETIRLAEEGAEERPIVVLNACESARPNREFNGMGGFAHAFVKARAGAFIGTHWSVGDAPAYTFVEALYEEFAKKRSKPITLSEAVIKARAAARLKDDATWLAYVVYGHPHAKVTVE